MTTTPADLPARLLVAITESEARIMAREDDLRYIGLYDEAIAHIEADRAIVALHGRVHSCPPAEFAYESVTVGPCPTFAALASGYGVELSPAPRTPTPDAERGQR